METVGDFDELEELLGEIPDATSANPYSERSNIDYCQNKLSSLALDGIINLDKTEPIHFNSNIHVGLSDETHAFLGERHQSTYPAAHLDESDLPQDHTRAHACAELGFINRITLGSAYPYLASHTCLRDQPALVNAEPINCYEKVPLNRKPWAAATQYPILPHNISSGFCNFRANDGEFRNQQNVCRYPIGSNSGTVPLGHGTQLFRPEVDFPVTSNHNYYLDASGLAYFHQPHECRPRMPSIYLEDQHHRTALQYLNVKQLENQSPIREDWSTSRRLTNACTVQSYGGMYNSQAYKQQYVRELTPDQVANSRCLYLSNPAVQVLEEESKPLYPEKHFSHSQKFHSYKPERTDPLRGHNCLASTNYQENFLLNGHVGSSFSTRNVCLQYNSLNSGDSFHDTDNNQKLATWKEKPVGIANGKIYHMAKDQNGCRFLQKKFDEGTPEDIERIFTEIIMHIVELMMHPFGNYLVQKLLKVCNEEQKMQILHEITRTKGDLVRISCDMHGTRAVQQVIKSLGTPQQFAMAVSSLRHGIVNLIKNMNGSHVAQCCLKHLTPEYNEFLFEAVASNCVEIATDRHGCCVLLKCLNHSDRKQIHHLVKEITSNALLLSQDPFGNYAVQFIFDINLRWARREIFDQLEGNYGDLAVQKYSSNVVEKCLEHAGEERRSRIIYELISNPRLDQMVQDPYGNYVTQSALKLSKGAVHGALVEAVRAHISVLKTSPYGKKVLSCNSFKK